MTNEQLYLALGVPILSNIVIMGLFTWFLNRQLDSTSKNIDSVKEVLRAELKTAFVELNAKIDKFEMLLKIHELEHHKP